MESQMLKQMILEAGIVGAGGAGFPTHIKLATDMEYLVVNAAECEPLLYTDEQLLSHYGREIVATIHEVITACGIGKAVIGMKKKHKVLIERLSEYTEKYSNVKIVPTDNIYPIGDELTLIRACTGKVVERGQLPSSQGVVVMNVETLWNIHEKVSANKNVTHTYVTINGEVANPMVYCVPIGMTIRAFVKSIGEVLEGKLILMGGPMMGRFVGEDTVITKTTKGIILLPNNHFLHQLKQRATSKSVKRIMSSCSQCRMCTDLCPRNRLGHKVEPHKLMNAFANGILQHYEGIDTALGCCGCNLCSYYSCHHGLSPGTLMTEVKQEMLKAKIKPTQIIGTKAKEEKYLQVPSERLVERIGFGKYKSHPKLSEAVIEPQEVRIPFSQHIGQPSTCSVKEGEKVVCGQVIAEPAKNALGTTIHSSINGIIKQIKSDCIVIQQGEER
ncbi:MAG: 4Fe-4S dicluster domain-containing protein [Cellulosilyticaceae bacterium]